MNQHVKQHLAAIALWYPFFGIPAILGGAIVWLFLRHRIDFQLWDALQLVVPWLMWHSLEAFHLKTKSLSNALSESVGLGVTVAIIFAARAALGADWAAGIALTVSMLAAVCIWTFVPVLPE